MAGDQFGMCLAIQLAPDIKLIAGTPHIFASRTVLRNSFIRCPGDCLSGPIGPCGS
jgi:hypothetical protein